MTVSPMTFNGMNVIVSDGGHFDPVRRHSKAANQHKSSYHARIQKKWLKRFGSKWVEIQKRGEIFMLGDHSIVVRHDDWFEMQRKLNAQ